MKRRLLLFFLLAAEPVGCRHRAGVRRRASRPLLDQARICVVVGRADTRSRSMTSAASHSAVGKAVDLPVNAISKAGFAHEPEKVRSMSRAELRPASPGCRVEDSNGDKANPLYERALRSRDQGGGGRRSTPTTAARCWVGRWKRFYGGRTIRFGDRTAQRLLRRPARFLRRRHQIEGSYRGVVTAVHPNRHLMIGS